MQQFAVKRQRQAKRSEWGYFGERGWGGIWQKAYWQLSVYIHTYVCRQLKAYSSFDFFGIFYFLFLLASFFFVISFPFFTPLLGSIGLNGAFMAFWWDFHGGCACACLLLHYTVVVIAIIAAAPPELNYHRYVAWKVFYVFAIWFIADLVTLMQPRHISISLSRPLRILS